MTEDLHDLRLDVGLLKKDVQLVDRLCNSLSMSIAKLEEVNTNLLKMITLHEQKHEQHEKVELEVKDEVKELHSRITTVSREIHDRMDDIEQHISTRIDELRNDIFNSTKMSRNQNFRNSMDKYKWMIVGAATTIGWIIGHVNLTALDKLFK